MSSNIGRPKTVNRKAKDYCFAKLAYKGAPVVDDDCPSVVLYGKTKLVGRKDWQLDMRYKVNRESVKANKLVRERLMNLINSNAQK